MVLLTNLIYVIFALSCFSMVYSAIAVLKDVTRMWNTTKYASDSAKTDKGEWLHRLEKDSYIMSLKVVSDTDSVCNSQDQLQKEVEIKAKQLREKLARSRSNYGKHSLPLP